MLKYHIQTVELTSAQKTIQFNSIPQDFTDLYVSISGRSDRTSDARDELFIQFNGDTSNYSSRSLRGSGSGTDTVTSTAAGITRINLPSATTTSNTFGNGAVYISNYNSNVPKPVSVDNVMENNATFSFQEIVAGLWNNTSPITRMTVFPEVGNFTAGSTISLYGIRRGSDGLTSPVAQGGTVTTSGGYTIHTFNTSGTFVANRNLNAEVLTVAGGGGGGNGNGGGGGGAGGVLQSTAFLTTGNYPVVVGAGGGTATDGNNSTFSSLTALKGGRGGSALSLGTSQNDGAGGAGTYGSGGGVARERITVGVGGGLGTSGQGNNGGNSDSGGYTAGGGGGAGAVGQNALTNENAVSPGGDGGAGITSSISGTSTYYGGGGGACGYQAVRNPAGGIGGGGRGSMRDFGSLGATAGTANTGGGGGGGGTGAFKSSGQAGGSGVVIIRYLTP